MDVHRGLYLGSRRIGNMPRTFSTAPSVPIQFENPRPLSLFLFDFPFAFRSARVNDRCSCAFPFLANMFAGFYLHTILFEMLKMQGNFILSLVRATIFWGKSMAIFFDQIRSFSRRNFASFRSALYRTSVFYIPCATVLCVVSLLYN